MHVRLQETVAVKIPEGTSLEQSALGGLAAGEGHYFSFVSDYPPSYHRRDPFAIRTTSSITGTSIKTPTTVASAAPE